MLANLFQSTYTMVSRSIRYVMDQPLNALSAVLYFQASFVDALDLSKPSPICTNQNTDSSSPNCFYVSQNVTEQQLLNRYYVFTNVNTLADAELFIVGEVHGSEYQDKLKAKLVASFARPGDVLLFEGLSMSEQFHCDSFHKDENRINSYVPKNMSFDPMALKRAKQVKFHFNFDSRLICKGWENISLWHASYKMMAENSAEYSKYKSLEPIKDELEQMSDELDKNFKQGSDKSILYTNLKLIQAKIDSFYTFVSECSSGLEELNRQLDLIEETPLALPEKIDSIMLSSMIREQYNYISHYVTSIMMNLHKFNDDPNYKETVVKKRNRNAIKTLDDHKNPQQRKFLFAGAAHLFPSFFKHVVSPHDISTPTLDTENASEPQFELAKYLEGEKVVCLTPKKY